MVFSLSQKLFNTRNALVLWGHRRRLAAAVTGVGDRAYQAYLECQLVRTLLKRTDILPARVREFIDRISDLVDLSVCHVLCVGCRNSLEIDYFRSKGAREVLGIDLYSESPSIRVMDMHALTFSDGTFDLLFSCHSLEHAYDPARAAAEFLRVVVPGGTIAVEVPIHFPPTGADLTDFGELEQLHRLFASRMGKTLLVEELPPPEDCRGTATMRTIFKVGSDTSPE